MRSLDSLCSIVKALRAEGGCPWDREQTLESLKSYIIEEAYEAYEAIEEGSPDRLKDELGDQLLHIVMLSEICAESGSFDIDDVIEGISKKLIRRHPHVFEDVQVSGSADVVRNWAEIKRAERGEDESALAGLPGALPALLRAYRLSERAALVGFDWAGPAQVIDKLHSEIDEFFQAVQNEDESGVTEECGDILFTLVNLCRHMGVNPEDALQKSNRKFESRFVAMERRLRLAGMDPGQTPMEEMDKVWEEIKARE